MNEFSEVSVRSAARTIQLAAIAQPLEIQHCLKQILEAEEQAHPRNDIELTIALNGMTGRNFQPRDVRRMRILADIPDALNRVGKKLEIPCPPGTGSSPSSDRGIAISRPLAIARPIVSSGGAKPPQPNRSPMGIFSAPVTRFVRAYAPGPLASS